MKAITLTQPWATLVAIGDKKIETRSWSTKYRGPLAIHAAKGFPQEAKLKCSVWPFDGVLYKAGILWTRELPRGAVVAICHLVDCIKITPDNIPPEPERSFGYYTPGRYAWILEDIVALPAPVSAKGALSLWEWRCGQDG